MTETQELSTVAEMADRANDAVEQIIKESAPVVSEGIQSEVTEVVKDAVTPDTYRAESIGIDGDVKVAIFSGPEAEDRANEYADTQNAPAENSQFANPEQEALPEPTKIHPIELGYLIEKAIEKNPDLDIMVDKEAQTVTLEGVRYTQTVDVPASPEALAVFEKQMQAFLAAKRRMSVEGLREELDALKAEVEDLKSRIDDHNSRSGHKI